MGRAWSAVSQRVVGLALLVSSLVCRPESLGSFTGFRSFSDALAVLCRGVLGLGIMFGSGVTYLVVVHRVLVVF